MTTSELGSLCMQGNAQALGAYLQEHSADIDLKQSVAWTDSETRALQSPPIFICIDYGYLNCVQLLLEGHGVDANIQDDHGYTPAQWAAWKGHVDILQVLIDHGAKIDQETLDLAQDSAEDQISPQVMALIRQHMDPYAALEGDDDEIIMKACREGDVQKVQGMLDAGYDYNKWKAPDGKYQLFSPMNMAVKRGHLEIVQLFMEEGVHIELGGEETAQETIIEEETVEENNDEATPSS